MSFMSFYIFCFYENITNILLKPKDNKIVFKRKYIKRHNVNILVWQLCLGKEPVEKNLRGFTLQYGLMEFTVYMYNC